MIRKIISTTLFIPFVLFVTSQKVILSETRNYIDEILEEKDDKIFIDYSEIDKIILNNTEIKSLQELVTSSKFDLSSKISKRNPTLNLQANGLPKYVEGKNYNSSSQNTKTSQISANPSLNIRWDLIDPLRDSEIKIAKINYKLAKNNLEIKKKDLIQEAKVRYHRYQKSYENIQNQKFALDLSTTSLKNAEAKLNSGIGTKFEVLEAEAQLSRDEQKLNEKKIEYRINEIALKEILNLKGDYKIIKKQKLTGFWNHKLNKNIKEGLARNLSLENSSLQKSIKENQARSFLNANKPKLYISNTFSSTFSKGDSLAVNLDNNKSSSSYTNTIGLNFSWNIFNGGENKKSYRSNKSAAKAEEYSYNNLKNILKTNISKAYLNLKLNEEKISSSLKEISSTNESLRLARLRYEVGITTLKDVLVIQKELSAAKTKKINAIFNYNLNLDELERLTYLDISNNCYPNDNDETNSKDSICALKI